jgi:hypothetical protein
MAALHMLHLTFKASLQAFVKSYIKTIKPR